MCSLLVLLPRECLNLLTTQSLPGGLFLCHPPTWTAYWSTWIYHLVLQMVRHSRMVLAEAVPQVSLPTFNPNFLSLRSCCCSFSFFPIYISLYFHILVSHGIPCSRLGLLKLERCTIHFIRRKFLWLFHHHHCAKIDLNYFLYHLNRCKYKNEFLKKSSGGNSHCGWEG